MKKILFYSLFSLLAITGIAQPSNIGFENWGTVTGTTAEDPTSWVSHNVLNNVLLGSNPVTLTKVTGTDKHSGTYAAKLTTVRLNSPPSGWALNDTVGFMSTGKLTLTAPYLYLGYPETQKPSTFNFWGKYTPNGADTASALIILLKQNGSNKDTVGVGYSIITGTVSTYTQYMVPVIYNATVTGNPDTAIIAFSSSGNNKPKVGSAFYIDDLSFGFSSGIQETGSTQVVKVFPNPAVKEINISFSTAQPRSVAIMSAAGQYVGTYQTDDTQFKMNTEKLAAGVYLFFVKDNNDVIIDTGKFTVSH